MRIATLAALVLAAAPSIAQEAPRYVLSHQGRLLVGDQPATGAQKLTFRIYKTPIAPPFGGEQALWTASYQVNLFDGVYAVALGESQALSGGPLTLEAIGGGEPRWMSIELDGVGELAPRLRLGSVPRATYADVAGTVDCEGCIDAAALKDGAVTLAKIAPGTLTAELLKKDADGTVTGLSADTLDGFDSSAFAPSTAVDAVKAVVDQIKSAVEVLGTKSDAIKQDVGVVRADVGTVKDDVAAVRQDVAGVKQDVGAVKQDVSGVATKVANAPDVWTKVQALETKLNALDTKLEALSEQQIGRKTCPNDMALVGTAGATNAFCIDKDERASVKYATAIRTCQAQGRHVCTYNEWMAGCGVAGSTNRWVDGWEWGHFSEVSNVATLGGVTVYRLPFWHYTTPLVAKPGRAAEARRWLLLGTFLFRAR